MVNDKEIKFSHVKPPCVIENTNLSQKERVIANIIIEASENYAYQLGLTNKLDVFVFGNKNEFPQPELISDKNVSSSVIIDFSEDRFELVEDILGQVEALSFSDMDIKILGNLYILAKGMHLAYQHESGLMQPGIENIWARYRVYEYLDKRKKDNEK